MGTTKKFYFPAVLCFALGVISCGSSFSPALFDSNYNNLTKESSNNHEEIQVKRISFEKSIYKLHVGEEIKIGVKVFPSTATNKVSLECPDANLISINQDLHTITALEVGETNLIAKSDNGLNVSCKIKITLEELKDFSLDKDEINLEVGHKLSDSLNITTTPASSDHNLKAVVLDNSVVNIDSSYNVDLKNSGQTVITVFNDKNNNNIVDENELKKDVKVFVHDYDNVIPVVNNPTCEADGSEVKTCRCGCKRHRKKVLPAKKHDFKEGIVTKNPTCTENGIKEYKCSHNGCKKIHQEAIPALGHDHSKKIIKDDNIAQIGDAVNQTSYYLTCSRCNHLSDKETFCHGYSNYIYSTKFDEQYGEGAPKMIETYNRSFNVIKSSKEKDLGTSIGVSVANLGMDPTLIRSVIRRLVCESPEYIYVGSIKSTTSNKSGITSFRLAIPEKYRKREDRIQYEVILDNMYKELSKSIRKDATDVEKALIIYAFVGNYLSYEGNYSFAQGVLTKKGVCQIYAKLFRYLATRFNLGAFCAYSKTHAWNHVNIDGKWYALDALWGESSSSVSLSWFCLDQKNVDSKSSSAHKVHDIMYVKLDNPALNSSLMTLYKNGALHGVYYSLDSLLKNVNDSKAKYEINFTVDNIAGYAINLSNKFHIQEAKTSLKKASFSSLNIRSEQKVTLKAPKEFFDQKNITYSSKISKVNV